MPADELLERLRERDLDAALVTAPEGRPLGVFRRRDAERRLGEPAPG